MASSMKSVEVIQEVKILPRATASHQPGSETRWREETNVRSRVEHVSRVGIEPRKWFEIVLPQGRTTPGCLILGRGNRGQSHAAGTPYPPRRSGRDRAEATGVGDQIMVIKG